MEEPLEEPTAPAFEPERPPPRGGPEVPWRLTLFLLLMVLLVVFAVQNTQTVELRFLGWSWELPLVIIIVATLAVSVLIDEVLGGMIRRQRQRRRLDREELKRLRDQR